jgi:predicted ATPase
MITQVSVRNYKSLARVDVDLNPLTVLVGPNGSGKSNFIDALRFVSEAVTVGLGWAVRSRREHNDAIECAVNEDQINEISFDITFQFEENSGEFRFVIGIGENGEYEVIREETLVDGKGYTIESGNVTFVPTPQEFEMRMGVQDRLALPTLSMFVSGIVRDYLEDAGYYLIFPNSLRKSQALHSAISELMVNGGNLGSVLRRLKEDAKEQFDQLVAALGKMVPGIVDIIFEAAGGNLAVKLIYQYGDQTQGFYLAQESDGTLRLLGLLTALYQQPAPSLITIEEPELAVHPGALQTLYEVIKEASERIQIIITTHSPDLIALADPDDLRIVEKDESGATRIGRLEKRQIEIIQAKLFSTSELLYIEGLRPESPAQ